MWRVEDGGCRVEGSEMCGALSVEGGGWRVSEGCIEV